MASTFSVDHVIRLTWALEMYDFGAPYKDFFILSHRKGRFCKRSMNLHTRWQPGRGVMSKLYSPISVSGACPLCPQTLQPCNSTAHPRGLINYHYHFGGSSFLDV